MDNCYYLLKWPESYYLSGKEWFSECILAVTIETYAYFVPEKRYFEMYPEQIKIRRKAKV